MAESDPASAQTPPDANGGVAREALTAYLRTTLDAETGGDWALHNGLQVDGRAIIRKLITGVSACQALFDEAGARGADAILVHHGLFWHGQSPLLTGVMGRRVRTLIAHNINLYAYHLPLDRDPEFGNNALAARAFGLTDITSFSEAKGMPIGFRGSFPVPISVEALHAMCLSVFDQAPLIFDGGPAAIRTLGIVSGGAGRDLYTAIDAGLDAFITGEPEEWAMNLAREAGVHFVAAGHHATERLGVRALGEHLADRFGIDVAFVDVPNPV